MRFLRGQHAGQLAEWVVGVLLAGSLGCLILTWLAGAGP